MNKLLILLALFISPVVNASLIGWDMSNNSGTAKFELTYDDTNNDMILTLDELVGLSAYYTGFYRVIDFEDFEDYEYGSFDEFYLTYEIGKDDTPFISSTNQTLIVPSQDNGWQFGIVGLSFIGGWFELVNLDLQVGNDEYFFENSKWVYNSRVPESSTLALMGLGLLGFGFSRRKKASKAFHI